MNVEPIDVAFEAEVSRLVGKRRQGESVEDHLKRFSRVRSGLRRYAAAQLREAAADITWTGTATVRHLLESRADDLDLDA